MSVPTAYEAGETLLRTATGRELLRGYAALTRRMQASETARVAELDRTADLRAQRDLIEAELLRRLGEA